MKYYSLLSSLAVSVACLCGSAQAEGYDDGVDCLAFISVLEQGYGSTPETVAASSGWREYIAGLGIGTGEALASDVNARSQAIYGTMAQKSSDNAAVAEYLTSFASKCETPPPPPVKDAICYAVAGSVRDGMDFMVSATAYNMSLQSGAEYEASRQEMVKAKARLAEAEKALAHYEGAPKASADELLMLLKTDTQERDALLDRCLTQMD